MFKHGSNKCSRYLARRKEMPRKEQIIYCKVNILKFILSHCFSAACYMESNTEKESPQSLYFLWSLGYQISNPHHFYDLYRYHHHGYRIIVKEFANAI